MRSLKEAIDAHSDNAARNMHTALPGIIVSFDTTTQRATVQLAINRMIEGASVEIPPVLDVPVVQPSAGGFHLTLPIASGDECLVVFSERAIDNWDESGGTQDPIEFRLHDISDGFAIIGVNCKPNAVPSYSADSMEIRNTSGTQRIVFNPTGKIIIDTSADVVITSATRLDIEAPTVAISGTVEVTGSLVVNDIVLESHKHPGDSGGTTGIPNL